MEDDHKVFQIWKTTIKFSKLVDDLKIFKIWKTTLKFFKFGRSHFKKIIYETTSIKSKFERRFQNKFELGR